MPGEDTDTRHEAQPLDCKDCDGYGQYYARVGYCQSDVDAVDCETCGGTGKRPEPSEAQPTREELNELARDMCLLVMSPTEAPTLDELAAMTTAQVIEVENWAALVHLDASDSLGIEVPERPTFLPREPRS